MSKPLRTAVIGVGYLGRFHAQKYAQLDESELIGVVDSNIEQAQKVAQELSVPAFENYHGIIDQVDAVSVVVPTIHHFEIVKAFLENGVHVLVEKPFTATLEQAEALLHLSKKQKVCLQVGHLERFNSVFIKFQDLIEKPGFIETTRVSSFPERGTDVDVVLDLMIHDIDLVLALTGEYPNKIQAVGMPILTKKVDMSNVRLEFPSGCVVNMTASRISNNSERQMRIIQSKKNICLYLTLDYEKGEARKIQVNVDEEPSMEDIKPEIFQLDKTDALMDEIQDFIKSILTGESPRVTALDGLKAMQVAEEINSQIKLQNIF